jgi:hypothetical protein
MCLGLVQNIFSSSGVQREIRPLADVVEARAVDSRSTQFQVLLLVGFVTLSTFFLSICVSISSLNPLVFHYFNWFLVQNFDECIILHRCW